MNFSVDGFEVLRIFSVKTGRIVGKGTLASLLTLDCICLAGRQVRLILGEAKVLRVCLRGKPVLQPTVVMLAGGHRCYKNRSGSGTVRLKKQAE